MAKDKPEIRLRKRRKEVSLGVPSPAEGFRLISQGNLRLVRPEANAHWSEKIRPFRSLIFDREGRVVSCGLPKFFTHQEDRPWALIAEQALDGQGAGSGAGGQDILAEVKHDGILVIRSVIRGSVVFRTRGSFDGEHHAVRIERIASERYPGLLDPALLPDASLHFELVGPAQRILIPYAEEDLIFLGGIDHSTLRLLERSESEELARGIGLRLAELWPLEAGASLESLQQAIDNQREVEGLVLRFSSGQRLLKLKNTRYEDAARRRYELHPKKLETMIRSSRLESAEGLRVRLGIEPDDPLADYVGSVFDEHLALEHDVEAAMEQLQKQALDGALLSKKRFSKELAQPLGSPRAEALMAIRDGLPARARELLLSRWRNERFGDPSAEGI